MKTDPTHGISGATGMPLSQDAIQSGRNSTHSAKLNSKPDEAISDTFETTDREGDGQLTWQTRDAVQPIPTEPETATGEGLDLEA